MSHKARHGAHRNSTAGKGSYPSLADIVRKETDGGRLVVRFLMSAMQGDLQDAKPCHRLDAARQLLKLGAGDARLYVAEHGLADNASYRRNGSHAPNGRSGPKMPLNPGASRLHTTPDQRRQGSRSASSSTSCRVTWKASSPTTDSRQPKSS